MAWRADDAPAVFWRSVIRRSPGGTRSTDDPDLRVAQARMEDRGDWTGSEHVSFAVVTADDDALLVQVMRVGSYPVLPRPGPQAHSDG